MKKKGRNLSIPIVLTAVLGFIAGGTAMNALQKAMAVQYAYAIHDGRRTLDDVKPHTPEYVAYVKAVYEEKYHEKL